MASRRPPTVIVGVLIFYSPTAPVHPYCFALRGVLFFFSILSFVYLASVLSSSKELVEGLRLLSWVSGCGGPCSY